MHLTWAPYKALFEGLDWRRMVSKPVVAPLWQGDSAPYLGIVLLGFSVSSGWKSACRSRLIFASFPVCRPRS